MKDIEKYLNSLQLAHLKDPTKCSNKKCELPGCVNCLCGMRSDSKCCCSNHRSMLNNTINNKRHFAVNSFQKIHKKNTLIIKDFFKRRFLSFEKKALDIANFDFSMQPLAVIINGKQISIFDDIVMWKDENEMYHLEKINI